MELIGLSRDWQRTEPPRGWRAVTAGLADARNELDCARPGIRRQAAYTHLLEMRVSAARLVDTWTSEAVGASPVTDPWLTLVLGDRVLVDESADIPAVDTATAIAIRALQLAGVGVVSVSGMTRVAVDDAVARFHLVAGCAEYGAGAIGSSPSVVEQLAQLHDELRLDPDVVIDSRREHSLRAARVVDGRIDPIAGARARAIVEHCGLGDLTFRIHPHYTDFFDARLSRPAVRPVALAAMASAGGVVAIICDSADLDIVEMARVAYVPATMPCGAPPRRRTRLVRAGLTPLDALWAAVWHLVPGVAQLRHAAAMLACVASAEWIPHAMQARPSVVNRIGWRIAAPRAIAASSLLPTAVGSR